MSLAKPFSGIGTRGYNAGSMEHTYQTPVVLALSGHDPSGGAGIQADIEAIGANGCHCCTVVTCLTRQDSCDVYSLTPLPADEILEQARTILQDSPVAALKIGLLGGATTADAIASLLASHPQLPVVLDPVLVGGRGSPLSSPNVLQVLRERLLPHIDLLTPNRQEARTLASATALEVCASAFQDLGCPWVLITGADEATAVVSNRLYGPAGALHDFDCALLPGRYHGSGCTLAAAIAAQLALGLAVPEAVRTAQEYTWNSLRQGLQTGRCQAIPNRWHPLRSAPWP